MKVWSKLGKQFDFQLQMLPRLFFRGRFVHFLIIGMLGGLVYLMIYVLNDTSYDLRGNSMYGSKRISFPSINLDTSTKSIFVSTLKTTRPIAIRNCHLYKTLQKLKIPVIIPKKEAEPASYKYVSRTILSWPSPPCNQESTIAVIGVSSQWESIDRRNIVYCIQ